MLCVKLVAEQDMGVRGLGIATLLSYLTMMITVTIHMHCIPAIQEALFWPDKSSFQHWSTYIAISLPATVMLCAEVWAVELMSVLAGWMSVNDQAVNAILLCLFASMYMFAVGSQSAASALVGEHIGANQVQKAKDYFKLIIGLTLMMVVFIQVVMYTYRREIVGIFTEDKDINELTTSCMYIIILGFCPDAMQGTI